MNYDEGRYLYRIRRHGAYTMKIRGDQTMSVISSDGRPIWTIPGRIKIGDRVAPVDSDIRDYAKVEYIERAIISEWKKVEEDTMGNTNQKDTGLYHKYNVERTDGSSGPGGKHEDCAYFVLDLDHDPHALPALRAYADSCEQDFPKLSHDLRGFCAAIRMRLLKENEIGGHDETDA